MNSDWYHKAHDREERKKLVLSGLPALKVLKEILEHRLTNLNTDRRSKTNYESPAWPMLQADYLGRERELEYLLNLLDQEEMIK